MSNMSKQVPVGDGIYLVFHIQFCRYAMKLLSVAVVNFHTNSYSCIVTATRHVMWFRVWRLCFIVCYIFTPLYFCTPLLYLSPSLTDPSPVQSRTVQRPTAHHNTATISCTAIYHNGTFQQIAVYWRHSTASPANTAVLQYLPAVSSRPSPGPPTHCSP